MSAERVVGHQQPKVVRKRVLALAWPAIVDQTLSMVVGMVDTAMVGRLGATALAAAGLGAQLMMASTAIFSAVTTGTTALVARFIGAQQPGEASRTARQSLLFGGCLAGTVALLLLWQAPHLIHLLFGSAEEPVLQGAAVYVRIVAIGLVPQFLLIVTNGIMRGSGNTRTPMQVMALVNVTNAALNYLLIFGVGPFPRLGLAGAAMATTIAHFVGGTIALSILFRGRQGVRLSIDKHFFSFETAVLKRVLNIGIPAGVEQMMLQAGQIVYTMIISSLGTVAYAAHRIALNAESLSFMPGFGFALAATTFVGQGLGAQDPQAAEQSGREAARMAASVMGAMGLLFFVFPGFFVRFFIADDAAVVAEAARVLRIVAVAQPFLAFTMVYAGGLRGAGDTRTVLLITVAGVCLVRVGVAYVLVRLGLGLVGAWIGMVSDLFVRGLLLGHRFRSGKWKYMRV